MEKQVSKKIIIAILIILIILAVLLLSNAFSKYITELQGTGTAQVAGIKCQTLLVPHDSTVDNINPYCEIIVKNTEDDVLTEMAYEYILTVTATDGTLPAYYCLDAEGNEVANSTTGTTTITGEFGNTTAETAVYTLYFVNTGESDFTQNIKIETNTVQK